MVEDKKLLSVIDLMRILDTGRNTIYKLLRNGDIKSVKVGRSYKIDEEDLKDYIDTQKLKEKE